MVTETKKFFGLMYDRIFKAVALNEEKNYTFLNALLTDIVDNEVVVIEANSYEVKVENILEKIKILDLLVRTKNNELINIELNNSFSKEVLERNLIYYFDIIGRGFKHFNNIEEQHIAKRMQINLNFNKVGKHFKEYIKIYNVTEQEVYYDQFEIINVNVLKYKKMCYDKIIKGNKEHISLVSLVSNKEELEELGMKDSIIREVGNKVFEMNNDEEIRDQMERELEAKIVYQNGLKYAKQDGIKVGYDSGIKEGYDNGVKDGFEDAKISIVKKMLQKGNLPTKEIAELTNLEEDKVLEIQKEMLKDEK